MDPGIFDCGSEQHVGWAPILWPSNNETDDQPIDLGHIWARYFQAKLYFRAFNAVSPCVFKQEGGLAIKTGLQGVDDDFQLLLLAFLPEMHFAHDFSDMFVLPNWQD